MSPAAQPRPPAPPAVDDEQAALMREVLHRVNNLAARLLLRSEIALESGDALVREEALRAAAETAEELGRYVMYVREQQRAAARSLSE